MKTMKKEYDIMKTDRRIIESKLDTLEAENEAKETYFKWIN